MVITETRKRSRILNPNAFVIPEPPTFLNVLVRESHAARLSVNDMFTTTVCLTFVIYG